MQSIIKSLEKVLSTKGFLRFKNGYLRLHGDGVFQNLYSRGGDHRRSSNKQPGDPLLVAIHSSYEKSIFEPIQSFRGQLTHPKTIKMLSGFCTGNLAEIAIERNNLEADNYQQGFHESDILSVLDMIDSQEKLLQSILWTDVVRNGEVNLIDSTKIAPLAYLHRYDEAIQVCEAIIAQNEKALYNNETWMSPKQFQTSCQDVARKTAPLYLLKEYMQNNDSNSVQMWLHSNRHDNLLLWKSIVERAQRTGGG